MTISRPYPLQAVVSPSLSHKADPGVKWLQHGKCPEGAWGETTLEAIVVLGRMTADWIRMGQ